MIELLEALLASTLDYAPALVFAALGATLSERAGVVSLHVEGLMRTGAFVAAVAALALPTPLAVCGGMAAAAAVAGVAEVAAGQQSRAPGALSQRWGVAWAAPVAARVGLQVAALKSQLALGPGAVEPLPPPPTSEEGDTHWPDKGCVGAGF